MMTHGLLAAPLVVLLASTGCHGPVGWFPGGGIEGSVSPAPSGAWPLEDGSFRIALETQPDDPYSVHVNVTARGGRLYVDPAPERRWGRNLAADPRARIVLYGPPAAALYEVTAVRVSDAGELAGFGADRLVYRLDPRPAPAR